MRYFLLLLLFVSELTSFGQQYRFREFSTDKGLAASQVRSMCSDRQGHLWIGTLEGVSVFNGFRFETFSQYDGLLSKQVNVVLERRNGQMVFGCVGGISVMDKTDITSWSMTGAMAGQSVRCMAEDDEGTLWIGTQGGICTLKGDSLSHSKLNLDLQSQRIRFIGFDNESMVIATTWEVIRINSAGDMETLFMPEQGVSITGATITSNGEYWITTNGSGLIRIMPEGNHTYIKRADGLVDSQLRGVIEDAKGNLWVHSRYGCSRFDGEVAMTFTEENGLPTPDVRCITQDYEGNIWIGTDGQGIQMFAGDQIVGYTTESGMSSNLVLSITEDHAKRMYLSTYDGGINVLAGDSVESIDLEAMGSNNRVWSSLTDSRGRTWFGTVDGIWVFDGGETAHITPEDGLNSRTVYSLFEGRNGVVWAGTNRGPHHISLPNTSGEPRVTALQLGPEIEGRRIRRIVEDLLGNIWLASDSGLIELSTNGIRHFSTENGLPENSLFTVEVDDAGHVWTGGASGLGIVRGDSVVTLKLHSLPISNHINFLESSQGTLWAGTKNGLYFLSLDNKTPWENPEFVHVGVEDGLGSDETNQNAVFTDSEGNLWIGTINGTPNLDITRVRINLLDADWGERGIALDPLSGLPDSVGVKHNENHFSFNFRAINFRYPDNVLYSYMLDGFDDDWQPETEDIFASYSNLPYDQFTFKVRAKSKSGNWSEIETFTFSIATPFWFTPWFIALEILAVLFIVGVIFNRRRKLLLTKIEKEKFEYKSKMLALEQQTLNSSLNRHFIFNALNSIQYYINRKDRMAANKYLSSFAKLIRKNLDSSQTNLTSLREEIERLELYLGLEHMRFKDKFEYNITIAQDVDQDGVKVPAMLLQPFLENSIWHGILPKNEPGEVNVEIFRNNGHLEFVITDDGIGIDTSLKNKMGNDNHISKGMAITSGRIELIKKMTGGNIELHGPYEIHDGDNEVSGTQVRIILPIDFHKFYLN
jgi:ligand-binding sensor domain-containing protein